MKATGRSKIRKRRTVRNDGMTEIIKGGGEIKFMENRVNRDDRKQTNSYGSSLVVFEQQCYILQGTLNSMTYDR